MRFEEPTKWELFFDGFCNILYILDCYDDGDKYGYREFWESLSIGWMQEYIYPYDDPYYPTISKERRLRLAEETQKITLPAKDFDVLVEMLELPSEETMESIKRLANRKAPWDDNDE